MSMRVGIVLVAVGVITGCTGRLVVMPAIVGSGVSKQETRAVDAFHALDASNVIEVTVTVTSGAKPEVKISGDDSTRRCSLVESVVQDGKLILRLKDHSTINPKLPLLAEVVVSELDEVEASGAANVKVKGEMKVNRFTASTSGAAQLSVEGVESSEAVARSTGASQLVLSGSSTSLKVDASEASRVKAEGLKAEDAKVSNRGASTVELWANKSVGGDVSDASRLLFHGSPAKNTVSISGASQVIEKK